MLYIYVSAQAPINRKRPRDLADTTKIAILNPDYENLIDTTPQQIKKISKNAVTSIVKYSAKDSVVHDLKRRYTYLFGEAVAQYEDMELRADYIEMDYKTGELYACGVADSNGIIHGNPIFVQGGTNYRAREIKFNFNTKKGKISHVITTQDDGYIHGEQVKKIGDNVAFIKRGKYTTCELMDPHFEIAFSKAKFIQHDKIVIGPAYLSFSNIPTPLALPFGFFPLDAQHKSGLVMPSFGRAGSLGFFLQDLGFYFAINDNIDLLLSADLYTRGSWALKAKSNYIFKYKAHRGLLAAADVIAETEREFAEIFGRKYSGLIEQYRTEDAELILVTLGSIAGLCRETADRMRMQGIRAGVIRIRYMRPFPNAEIAEALRNAKAFAVLEKDISFGNEGTVFTNVNSALQKAGLNIPGQNYIGGLGGRNISAGDIEAIFRGLVSGAPRVSFIGIGGDGSGE